MEKIKEFHVFAGIGGGIYGGSLLNHECCGAVEILPYAQQVLKQRQIDGWMNEFPIYGDICNLNGNNFKGKFDILCGGFPCQAFSTAAHGKNIAEKNLWKEMFRFVVESDAPVVFGENVILRAIEKAKADLESVGYRTIYLPLSCSDVGADHQRKRYWLLGVKNDDIFNKMYGELLKLPKFTNKCWTIDDWYSESDKSDRRLRLLGVGNAQSPLVAATAFRMLCEYYVHGNVLPIEKFVNIEKSIIQNKFNNIGLVHTPTTMANYSCPSMMKHQGCRNFKEVFSEPTPENAEWLMGFPYKASSRETNLTETFNNWKNLITNGN